MPLSTYYETERAPDITPFVYVPADMIAHTASSRVYRARIVPTAELCAMIITDVIPVEWDSRTACASRAEQLYAHMCASDYVAKCYTVTVLCTRRATVIAELADGGSLREAADSAFARDSAISVPLSIIAAVAQAVLRGAHALRTVCGLRRICPRRILLTREGRVMLSTKCMRWWNTFPVRLRIDWRAHHSLPYLPPGRLAKTSEAECAADVWAVGVIALELALAHSPLRRGALRLSKDAILDTVAEAVFDLADGLPDLDDDFRDFLGRALCVRIGSGHMGAEPPERARAEELLEHPFLECAASADDLSMWLAHMRAEDDEA